MKNDETAMVQRDLTRPTDIMSIVQQIAASPNAEKQVAVMQALLEMREREEAREAKRLFIDALTDLQKNIPPMSKDKAIIVKGTLRSKYVSMDQMTEVVDPLMHDAGFSFTLSEVGVKDGMREFAGTLMHRAGHEKTITVHLPLDKSQFRSDVQSEGSTISYARRQLYKAHFNIYERGTDDDGSGQNVEAISDDERRDLETKIADTKANLPVFLQYFEIAELKDLKKADLARAHEMLDRKGRK